MEVIDKIRFDLKLAKNNNEKNDLIDLSKSYNNVNITKAYDI